MAPPATRPEVARAYAISKLSWIRQQQQRMAQQARLPPRRYVGRESHELWGRRYLLSVVEVDAKPSVEASHRKLTLRIRPGASQEQRADVMQRWYREQLHAVVPGMIRHWEARLGVSVEGYFLQRMKTKWGSCNAARGHIRLNTELVKKPKDLVEYVVLHELAHLVEPSHNERFVALLDWHWPHWRDSRAELNALPLGG